MRAVTSLTRRAPALLLALLIALAGSLLWSAPARAAAAATQTVTYSVVGLGTAVLSPAAATITAGQTVAFVNTDSATLTVSDGIPAKNLATVAPGATSAPIAFAAAGLITYTAASSHATLLGLVPLSALGSITVRSAAVVVVATPTPAPSTHPTNAAPVSHPAATPTSKAPTRSVTPGTSGASGASGSGGPGRTGGGTTKPPKGGSVVVPVTPASTPPPVYGGFAPGDFGTLAPQDGVGGDVLPPVVAPYATVTGPDGVPSTLYETYTPTASPVAAVSAGSGGGGSGRAIGLTGAITAVLLVGLVAAFGRLLLGHPAAASHRH
jgi:plastocyanin